MEPARSVVPDQFQHAAEVILWAQRHRYEMHWLDTAGFARWQRELGDRFIVRPVLKRSGKRSSMTSVGLVPPEISKAEWEADALRRATLAAKRMERRKLKEAKLKAKRSAKNAGAISRATKAAKGLPGLPSRNAGDQNWGDGRPSVPALRCDHHHRATIAKEQIALKVRCGS